MSEGTDGRPRPVVGVTAYEEEAAFGVWSERCALLPANYVRALEAAGAAVVLLPVQRPGSVGGELVDRLDALVLTGGPDVDPARYGAERHERTGPARAERDEFEAWLLGAAEARDLPLLAICRGLQVLNVARGGTLHQHLPELVGHDGHQPSSGEFGDHDVVVAEGSALRRVLGWDKGAVPTHHHQAIDRVGEGLQVTATAADGTVEAVEDPSRPFLLGVQWHPEAGDDGALFRALVDAAGAARGRA